MKSHHNFDALVEALRSDLPSERDSARLRAKLSAIGIAASTSLSGSAVAAGVTAASSGKGAAAATAIGKIATQVAGWSLAAKVSVVAAVSVSAAAGPAWYVSSRPVPEATPAARVAPRSLAAPSSPNTRNLANLSMSAATAQDSTPMEPASMAPVIAPNRIARPAEAAAVPTVPTAPTAPAMLQPLRPSAASGTATPAGVAKVNDAIVSNSAPRLGPAVAAISQPPQVGPGVVVASAPLREGKTGVASGSVAWSLPAVAPAEVESNPAGLREETLLIDRALSAIRARDLDAAERALADHERRFPEGRLYRERARVQRRLDELQRNQTLP